MITVASLQVEPPQQLLLFHHPCAHVEEEEENENFHKLRPASKTDRLCQV